VNRQQRKDAVFLIMYGWFPNATENEMRRWRGMAAQFVNGERDDLPLTLAALRATGPV